MTETTLKMKPILCRFCGEQIALSNCDKLGFKIGDYVTTIEFKKARYIEVTCGKCKEKTLVRNPKMQYWKKV